MRAPVERPASCHRVTSVLVVTPTLNEGANLLRFIASVLRINENADLLIVDDDSPDGTGRIAEAISRLNPRLHVIRRCGERGLGSAYRVGFQWALRRGYEFIVQMDADLSHDPLSVPRLLEQMDFCDLAIGSRYCPRGAVMGWPISRKVLSASANCYARSLLRVPIRDLTAGFRCWRAGVLRSIDFDRLQCDGYAFQVETSYLAHKLGARIKEVPILFVERGQGESKMSSRVVRKGARRVLQLARLEWTGQPHPALRRAEHKPVSSPIRQREKTLVLALGGIGDTVLAFAMARRLRALRPNDRITALAMWPQSAELLDDLGVFDEVHHHHFQQSPWWRSLLLVARLRRRRFDLSIQAFPANRSEYNLVHYLIHAGQRIGHDYLRGSNLAYLRWLLTDRIKQTLGTHNILENLKLLGVLEPGRFHDPPDISLGPLAPRYRTYADEVLSDVDRPLLGIHAGSSAYKNLHAKRWPPQRFAELARRVLEEDDLQPLLFGSGADRDINEAILNGCPAARIIETPSIRHTAAVMQRCSVFVSNDTALAHVASALDVPTVMVVGPTDGLEVGPFTRNGELISLLPNCAPCFRVSRKALNCRHPQKFACMKMINVDEVHRAMRNALARPRQREYLVPVNGDDHDDRISRPLLVLPGGTIDGHHAA